MALCWVSYGFAPILIQRSFSNIHNSYFMQCISCRHLFLQLNGSSKIIVDFTLTQEDGVLHCHTVPLYSKHLGLGCRAAVPLVRSSSWYIDNCLALSAHLSD